MQGKPIKVRVVIADERAAAFYDLTHVRAQPLERGELVNEARALKDQDLETDKPGRGFNHGGPGRHAMDGERSTVRHETELFALEVARAVDDARVRHEFDRLVIVAGPRMLGLIRDALPASCRSLVAAEVPKDLMHQGADALQNAVPRGAFLH